MDDKIDIQKLRDETLRDMGLLMIAFILHEMHYRDVKERDESYIELNRKKLKEVRELRNKLFHPDWWLEKENKTAFYHFMGLGSRESLNPQAQKAFNDHKKHLDNQIQRMYKPVRQMNQRLLKHLSKLDGEA